MAGDIIGKVQTIQGLVQVRSADGGIRDLMVGDHVREGDTALPSGNGKVTLLLADGGQLALSPGQTVAMTAELSSTEYPGPDEGQISSVDQITQAIFGDGDLNTVLEPTAAGPASAGAEEGHTFVRLLRVVENIDPQTLDTTAGVTTSPPAFEGFTPSSLTEDTGDTETPPPPPPPPQNVPPVAVADAAVTNQDQAVVIAVLGNDSDSDSDPLTITGVSQGSNGTVTINGDGTVTYTPNAGANGDDSFTYTISDGQGGTATATVNVTVNEVVVPPPVNNPPDAVDDSAVTDEGEPVTIAVLGNDTDPDGNPLTLTGVTQGSNGVVTINPDGTVTYTPNPGTSGNDSFTYTISDGQGGTDTATVTVTVNEVIDPPPPPPDNTAPDAVNDSVTIATNAPVIIQVLGNDSDPENDPLTVTGVTQGSNGTVTINPNGTVTYTPNPGPVQEDSFTYTISDGQGGTDTATVTINVDEPPPPVNTRPDAVNDTVQTNEDTAVIVPVLGNDTDPENDPLTVTAVSQGSNGTVVLNPNGTVTYTPNPNFNGTDSFQYAISDGNGGTDTATVTVTVLPVNDPPNAVDDLARTNPGQPVTVTVLDNDTDVDGDTLTVTGVGPATDGTVVLNPNGTITYTPNPGTSGVDTFSY
ncbi:retention module-containing protein, partial [Panacagrimonas sp.]|uniref:retention module-containing protein n=1 Tax=Panacagrimonas sp. TaxID=2480088 RepID=UPI003B51AE04